ncbi:unnamed protein product [Bursaphelenchus xylophilus]|uniref:(pine wood nematode) hypothetical protein n=1 Tax=Bursaphelenchus xylophilus TaxID=6326 RepID=A0A1I7SW98_BURXY|nr:unnamed protein product [Bursaphelenchus xylophilus]CAG9099062.1 unnamed protein product [Bursaphelenchus xylophilus]
MEDGALAQLIKMVGGCEPTPSTSHSTPVQSTPSPVQRPSTTRNSTSNTFANANTRPTVNTFFPQTPQPDLLQIFYFQQLMQQKFYADLMAMTAMSNRNVKTVGNPSIPTNTTSDPRADPLMSLYDMVNPEQKSKKEEKEAEKANHPNFSIEGLLCSQKSNQQHLSAIIKKGGVIKNKRKHIEVNRYSQ